MMEIVKPEASDYGGVIGAENSYLLLAGCMCAWVGSLLSNQTQSECL